MDTLTAADGTTIRFHRLGTTGRPVIFLHGWTAGSREWLPYAEKLSQTLGGNSQSICWDARGHGLHDAQPDYNTHIHHMAADLDQLICHLQREDVVLVGHSMGSLTAWQYIRDYGTAHLGGLCVIDQSPKLETDDQWQMGIYSDFDHQRNNQLIELMKHDFAEGVLQLVAQGHNRRSRENYENNTGGFQKMREYLQKLPATALIDCWQSLSREDYRAVLPQIDVPALLIYGDESQFYSQQLARWVADQIPDSELHIYEDSDHSPHMWHPERFQQQLAQFITQL
ncbi:MAG: alpha/beta hydrolase [Marinobacterium sp.]|nr:alpha/beta hydrolase [Marinobacterium sp.]